MSACSAIAASASAAPGTTFWRCISPSKKPSSSGQTRSAGDRPAVARRAARRESPGASRSKLRPCASATQSAKWRDHVEQHLVAVGDEQRPAAHALEPPPRLDQLRRRHVRAPRRRRGDRAHAPRGRRGPRRAAPGSPSRSRRSVGVEAGQGEQPLRPRRLAQRPAERRERQRLRIGRVCVVESASFYEVRRVGQKILVVEDNELNLKLFCDLLRAHGYAAEPVRDGREAVERARALRARLIVMDIQMPHVSGLELIEQLKGDAALQAHPDHGGDRLCRQGRRGADPRRRRRRLCLQADLGGEVRRGGAEALLRERPSRTAGAENGDGARCGCSRGRIDARAPRRVFDAWLDEETAGQLAVRDAGRRDGPGRDRCAGRRPLRDRRAARRRGGAPHRRL